MQSLKLAVLGSTRGTVLEDLIHAIQSKTLPAEIKIVISNKENAGILDRAKRHALPFQFISPKNLSREAYDMEVDTVLNQYHVDLILLIGYMRILSKPFVDRWWKKIINVHPSLLPLHSGLMDLEVHKAVLACGDKTTGCTIHYVTHEVDSGPILVQKHCPVREDDTPESLKARVLPLEAEAYIEAITQIQKEREHEYDQN